MSRHVFFIAGTDTDVGKTTVAAGLLLSANRRGLSTAATKPVAAGCKVTPEGLRNDDALKLQAAMSLPLSYEQVNPVAFEPPIAPHIAAGYVGRRVAVSQLAGFCRGLLMQRADFTLIEGAGGWRVPLNPRETMADLVRELNTPVILVVGMKLGCINHALLTVEAIQRDGLTLAGWVANFHSGSMVAQEENLTALRDRIPAPCLGEVPQLSPATAEAVSDHINLDLVISF